MSDQDQVTPAPPRADVLAQTDIRLVWRINAVGGASVYVNGELVVYARRRKNVHKAVRKLVRRFLDTAKTP